MRGSKPLIRRVAFSFAGVLIASSAFAHAGVGNTTGFLHGFAHPIGGPDHVLAMLGVGLFAALLGGRALWLVPLSFITMMAAGGALGMCGVNLPLVEFGIGLSVVAVGAAIMSCANMSVVVAMTFVGLFAIFHGYAHGTEMPTTVSGLEYGLGFLMATALLHACGLGMGLSLGSVTQRRGQRVVQLTGAAIAFTGIGMLAATAVA